MLLYLDNCSFNRPFDNQTQLSISLESQAKLFIQQGILQGHFQLLWSYVLEHENSKNPFNERLASIYSWKELAVRHIIETEEILAFGESLMDRGLKMLDALHIACAYYGGCERFITVDKKLINKPITEVVVQNPVEFIRELGA